MLIEYSVENFRSIADPITFTMLPARGLSKPNNLIQLKNNKNIKKLLKSSVVFGANASGKSNVIFALSVMKNLILNSKNNNAGDPVGGYFPFVLDSVHSNKPTIFKIHFIKDAIEYKYSFSFNSNRIIDEELISYSGKKEQRLFKRTIDDFEPGLDHLELKNLFKNTGENVLFLSKANNEYNRFRPVFEWFNKNVVIIGSMISQFVYPLNPEVTISFMNTSEENKQKVLKLLNHADFDIFDISGRNIEFKNFNVMENIKDVFISIADEIGKKELTEDKFDSNAFRNDVKIKQIKPVNIPELKSVRKKEDGSIIVKDFIPFESAGTNQFFNIIGYWLNALQEENQVLVIDEFDLRLHPDLQYYLVQLFHDPEINNKNSQLIITTHNTKLLTLNLFRREQIAFTEKDPRTKSTKILSLYDYEKRQDRSVEKNYFLGRYGGLPDITYGRIQ